jgi:hypothetical protein
VPSALVNMGIKWPLYPYFDLAIFKRTAKVGETDEELANKMHVHIFFL